jgi:hypothetical protein
MRDCEDLILNFGFSNQVLELLSFCKGRKYINHHNHHINNLVYMGLGSLQMNFEELVQENGVIIALT